MAKRSLLKQWLVGFAIATAAWSPSFVVRAAEAAPQVIAHEGRLLDAAGAPLHGVTAITFRLYAAKTGGAALWSETVDVEFDDGYFDVWLGEAAPLDASLLDGETRWLAIAGATVAESPTRIAVASTDHPVFADGDVAIQDRPVQAAPEPPAGAPGPEGPRRPAGVVLAATYADAALGSLANARDQAFIGATVDMTVAAGQLVLVSASAALGSTAPGGAGDLQLAICTRRAGSSLLVEDRATRRENLMTAENSRQTFALRSRLAGLAAGEYEIGLCGHVKQGASRWNNNDMSRVTVLLTAH